MSWGNWDFTGRTTPQQAANDFLNTGNFNTAFGGSACRSSADCASGFSCAGGRCVQKSSQQSSTGGTCGEGTGGGGCNALTISQGMTAQDASNRGFIFANGVGTKSFQWVPTYSADGCTVTGCSLAECGGGMDSDCPTGVRTCRYDAFGTVNCYCGEPEQTGCSVFCTAYSASTGEEAEGCSGLACDECSYCDETFVSVSGVCRPLASGGPCHCGNDPIPECHRCDESGSIVEDNSNCQECVTIYNQPCSCGVEISKTCCQPIGTDGLTIVNKCQDSIAQDCAEACGPEEVDPCKGVCVSKTLCQSGTCPSVPVNQPGKRNTATGCIEAGGQGCLLYDECDVSDVPEKCLAADCNCHNDCPNCQLCGTDGKCYADPSC